MIQINHFIQVKGVESVGKTTTIDWCFLKILENAKLKKLKYYECGDFVALLELNGKMIGLISAGDIKRVVNDEYEIFCEMCESENVCEIEVCVFATRKRKDSGSVEALEEILQINGKQKADATVENHWFSICNDKGGQENYKKKELANLLQKQSDELIKLIEKYL